MLSIDTLYPIFKKFLLVVLDAVTFFDWLDVSIIVKHYLIFLRLPAVETFFVKKLLLLR